MFLSKRSRPDIVPKFLVLSRRVIAPNKDYWKKFRRLSEFNSLINCFIPICDYQMMSPKKTSTSYFYFLQTTSKCFTPQISLPRFLNFYFAVFTFKYLPKQVVQFDWIWNTSALTCIFYQSSAVICSRREIKNLYSVLISFEITKNKSKSRVKSFVRITNYYTGYDQP